jgi:DNA-binding transcriptional regulator YdaS (Cro superfamily)
MLAFLLFFLVINCMKKSEVIVYFGSVAKIAKALGVNWSAVHQWGEKIPVRRAFELERLTKGELKVDEEDFPRGNI